MKKQDKIGAGNIKDEARAFVDDVLSQKENDQERWDRLSEQSRRLCERAVEDAGAVQRRAARELDIANLRKLLMEMTEMLANGDMTGVMVMIQRRDGNVYPHLVGSCDAIRMLGISHLYLDREANRQFSAWTGNAMSREKLERGL